MQDATPSRQQLGMSTDSDTYRRGAALVIAGATYRAAASEVGTSERSLREWMHRAGLAPQRQRGVRAVADPLVVRRLVIDEGMTLSSAAAELSVSLTAIRNAVAAAGITRTTRRPEKERELRDAERRRLEQLGRDDLRGPLLDYALQLYADGVPLAVTSRAAGRGRGYVHSHLRAAGRLPRSRPTTLSSRPGTQQRRES